MKKTTQTWLKMAKNDLSLARDLSDQKGRYHYAIHFCHQALEKGLKAIIAEKTGKIPFPTHNFKTLIDQSLIKSIPDEIEEFLIGMTPHYIATKYPEDIANLQKCYSKITARKILNETDKVMKWYAQKLKSKKS